MWTFPRRKPRDGHVLDPRNANAWVADLDAASASLDAANVADTLADEARASVLADAGQARIKVLADWEEFGVTDEVGTEVLKGAGWTVIQSYSFSHDGGVLEVLWSGQYEGNSDNNEVASLQTGIRVNGGTVPETVIGDQDSTVEGPSMELGLGGYFGGFTNHLAVRLPPGNYTVEGVAQVLELPGVTSDPILTFWIAGNNMLIASYP